MYLIPKIVVIALTALLIGFIVWMETCSVRADAREMRSKKADAGLKPE